MIIDTLQLPQLVFPVATITLGWPAEEPALTDRLPLTGIVHSETYSDYTRERIDEVYKTKEEWPDNQHFVEINHKETLAQVFTDLRYTEKDNIALSATLIDALRKQGFLDNTPKI
jgi:FMN reductase [NAD(P)H]